MAQKLEELNNGKFNLAEKLFTLMTHLRKAWMDFSIMPPFKRSDLPLLGAVDRLSDGGKKPVTVGQLARHTHQSLPAVSQKIRALEAAGYLVRTGDKNDRRIVYIQLSEKGAAISKQVIKEFMLRIEHVLEEMGEGKAEQLFTLMQEMCEAIDKIQMQEGVKKD